MAGETIPSGIKSGEKVDQGFTYDSGTNEEWMEPQDLKIWLDTNKDKLGKI